MSLEKPVGEAYGTGGTGVVGFGPEALTGMLRV